jgi:hypothetical protein
MWWKIPTGSALNRYANPAFFEILLIAYRKQQRYLFAGRNLGAK